jgi:putative transcriptional regulator
MVEQAIRETDWARLDAMTDEDIARAVASDPDAPPLMSPADMAAGVVRVLRKKLGLTQAQFAARFRIPVGTLRDWEQNRKQPDSTAIAYLRVIAKEPDMVAKVFAA